MDTIWRRIIIVTKIDLKGVRAKYYEDTGKETLERSLLM